MRRLCCGNPVVCCNLLQRTRGERMEPVQRPAADLAGERDQRPNVVPKQHVRVLLRAWAAGAKVIPTPPRILCMENR